MSAVITFVTLAAGIACSLPELPTKPRPETPTAPAPGDGQGSGGAVPGMTCEAGSNGVAENGGIRRRELTVAAATTTQSSAPPTRPRIVKKLTQPLLSPAA